tara:strand:+ start:451 stop:774 length:324 start_codon:yes stop_codon:yes gene_type:complete
MLVAELCILAARAAFHQRGNEAPSLDTLIWLWPACWAVVIIFCMMMVSWGHSIGRPSKGVVGGWRVALVMVLRLCISAGILAVPLIAVIYAIIMLVLALASVNAPMG